MKRLRHLAGRSPLVSDGPEANAEENREFLDLLERCQDAGADFGDLQAYEDDCPLCLDLKKQIVHETLEGRKARRGYGETRIGFDDFCPGV